MSANVVVRGVAAERDDDDEIMSRDEASMSLASSGQVQQRTLQEIQEAIEVFPESEKEAYKLAEARCPTLIQTESPPIKFLAYHRLDVWKAARQLLAFWKLRKELFGPRAWLPMHQTGNGALTEEEVEVVSSGVWSMTPREWSPHGKVVVCFASSRLHAPAITYSYEAKWRCCFYIHVVLMQLLGPAEFDHYLVVSYDFAGIDGSKRSKDFLRRAAFCFPLFHSKGFIVESSPSSSQPSTTAAALSSSSSSSESRDNMRRCFFEVGVPVLMNAVSFCAPFLEVLTYTAAQGTVVHQLCQAPHWFAPECIPAECGGAWSLEHFREWQQVRVQLEQEREARDPALLHLTQAFAQKQQRRRDLQKGYRQRHEAHQKDRNVRLVASQAACREENDRLRAESARLEDLLQEARQVMTLHGSWFAADSLGTTATTGDGCNRDESWRYSGFAVTHRSRHGISNPTVRGGICRPCQ